MRMTNHPVISLLRLTTDESQTAGAVKANGTRNDTADIGIVLFIISV